MFNTAYCSDKYQYTMGKSFYDSGMKDQKAIFNFFYRKAPENNNWAVVSGTDDVVDMITNLGKMPAEFFDRFLPGDSYKEYRDFLSTMKFTGSVWAMREGEIAFPNEPVIIIEAPLIEAQVLETPLLCIMNHQMAVATKASRVCRATARPVSEFGSRRAHGPWAATYGAKAAIIAGCANSSNILAGVQYDYPSTGTMAHSYVTSFGCSVEGEHTAFSQYIKTHMGEPLILLIDTYDTLKCGIKNAIRAFKENNITNDYKPVFGIRLDSGDLAYLSQKCRSILDANGLEGCKIFATNGLDEYLIADLERQGACIDSYGVGDAIATSKAAPCFGGVYKLVQIDEMAVLKRSEDKIKLINPGFQITYRIKLEDAYGKRFNEADLTCLRGDASEKKLLSGETITIVDENDRFKHKTLEGGKYEVKALQLPVILDGKVVRQEFTLQQKKEYFQQCLAGFDPSERRLINPHYYKVDISDELYTLKMQIINRLNSEIDNFTL